METVYLGIILFLFVLAAFDLVVGVSNDAVNFLSSAVGAKVAPIASSCGLPPRASSAAPSCRTA